MWLKRLLNGVQYSWSSVLAVYVRADLTCAGEVEVPTTRMIRSLWGRQQLTQLA